MSKKNNSVNRGGRPREWYSKEERSTFRVPKDRHSDVKKAGIAIDKVLTLQKLDQLPEDKLSRLIDFIENKLF